MSASINVARTRLAVTAYRTSIQAVRSFSSTCSTARGGSGSMDSYPKLNDPKEGKVVPNVSKTNETPVSSMGLGDEPMQEMVEVAEERRTLQAPNRKGIWSRSQMPREMAMAGPRFEQVIMEHQPRPYAAIELIHKQPVRWVSGGDRMVACDGGGGALGHPRVFINVDKPQICMCTYCGLPYAHTHHKKYLQSLPKEQLSYPLEPSDDPAVVTLPTTATQKGEVQGQYSRLKAELNAESVPQAEGHSHAFAQR